MCAESAGHFSTGGRYFDDGSGRKGRLGAEQWLSPDRRLQGLAVRYLQIGGDTWNRCGHGWINLDGNFDKGDGALGLDRVFVDDTGRFNMKHFVSDTSRLPFANESVQLVYSEHMLEHMLPHSGGINFLREAWRVLAPGGALRLVTPDLDKYVCGMLSSKQAGDPKSGAAGSGAAGSGAAGSGAGSSADDGDGFLRTHAMRFQPMQMLTTPPSRATVFNNIFRNCEHTASAHARNTAQLARTTPLEPGSQSLPCYCYCFACYCLLLYYGGLPDRVVCHS